MDKYRKDLDGLRAIAVLLVLFFHLDFTFLKAGFIGVDIFFTISGFLISGLVIKQSVRDGFSFRSFYIKRATRLLPAYLFMLLFIAIFCWFIFAPLAYFDFLKSALSSTLFISNIYFLINHSGYFSTSVHELPLLHTWSLAVEEQFYLIMPLFIVIWLKIKSFPLRIAALVLILILTTAFSIYLTSINQGASYFLVVSRVHEFFFGMFLAVLINEYKEKLVPSKLTANFLALMSLIVLISISILLSSKDNFPGYIAAIVCFCTSLLIFSGLNTNCVSHKLLGCKPMALVGLLSYSLYLWHWPIVSLFKYSGTEFTFAIQLIIIVLSFVGAILSYIFIEKPFRYGRYAKSGLVALLLYVAPAIFITAIILNKELIPSHYPSRVVTVEKMTKSMPEDGREQCHSGSFNKDDNCYLGVKGNTDNLAMLWGDSHASHFAPFVDLVATSKAQKVKDTTMGSCPPLKDVSKLLGNAQSACLNKNTSVLKYIEKEKIEEIYFSASWYGYYKEVALKHGRERAEELLVKQVKETLIVLKSADVKKVYFFATVARPNQDLSSCYFKHITFGKNNCQFNLQLEQQELALKLQATISSFNFVEFINVNSIFCKGDLCATNIDSVPLYRDGNHLNRYGSEVIAKKYMEFLDE